MGKNFVRVSGEVHEHIELLCFVQPGTVPVAKCVELDPAKSQLQTCRNKVVGTNRIRVIRTTGHRAREELPLLRVETDRLPFPEFQNEAPFDRFPNPEVRRGVGDVSEFDFISTTLSHCYSHARIASIYSKDITGHSQSCRDHSSSQISAEIAYPHGHP